MKIIVLNYAETRIDIINADDCLISEGVGKFLQEQGYSLSLIHWMAAPIQDVPIKVSNIHYDDDLLCTTSDEVKMFNLNESEG